MSGDIFRKYLRWFNDNVSRKVVLLIDNFSAHQSGWNIIIAEGGLFNVSVIFLSVDAISLCQPLDQGIISAFKAHYRQRWLEYMASEYDADREPLKTINVLMTIRWCVAASNYGVTQLTISNCWLKSRVIGAKYGPMTREEAEKYGYFKETRAQEQETEQRLQIQATIRRLKGRGHIQSAMRIGEFLNPVEEVVEDTEEDLEDHIVAIYGEEVIVSRAQNKDAL